MESEDGELDGHNDDGGGEKGKLPTLPLHNIYKVMKAVLPPDVKVARETKISMQECAFEFLGFITSEAAEKCRNERRKTISGEDILTGFATLGLDNYLDPLRLYLTKLREIRIAKKTAHPVYEDHGDEGSEHNTSGQDGQDEANPPQPQHYLPAVSLPDLSGLSADFIESFNAMQEDPENNQRRMSALQSMLHSVGQAAPNVQMTTLDFQTDQNDPMDSNQDE